MSLKKLFCAGKSVYLLVNDIKKKVWKFEFADSKAVYNFIGHNVINASNPHGPHRLPEVHTALAKTEYTAK